VTAKEALFYDIEGDRVRCMLCPQNCLIKAGERGICGVRKNDNSRLIAENYSIVTAISLDPIEKKPLYNFFPGSDILSLGTYGCNLKCIFCQNWSISQQRCSGNKIYPEQLLNLLQEYGGIGIAYTYNEPTIWYEFIADTAPLLKQNGYKTVIVTNGYINKEPLEKILPFIDAFNIDLKGFSNDFYSNNCKGRLSPVLSSIERVYGNAHLELTNLVVTGLNDDEAEFSKMVEYISNISKNIPLHISRYHPDYNYSESPTNIATINRFYEIAREKLDFVYVGNVLDKFKSSTFCTHCGKIVINRNGYSVENLLTDNICPFCGAKIEGIMNNQ